jgi:chromate reductase
MASYKVGYLVGSLSSTSINRLLAKALVRMAPPELQFEEIPIRDLPLYTPDYDADYPLQARAHHGRGRGDQRGDGAVPPQLPERIPRLHRARADRAATGRLTRPRVIG